MPNQNQKWIADGGSLYRLIETGRDKKDDEGNYVPEMCNEYHIRVTRYTPRLLKGVETGPSSAFKEKLLAEHIARLLNEFPLEEA